MKKYVFLLIHVLMPRPVTLKLLIGMVSPIMKLFSSMLGPLQYIYVVYI